jgi:hypothetical protein
LCFLCTGVYVFAQESSAAEGALAPSEFGIFTGLGTEINANSPRGPAISGSAVLGFDLLQNLAIGIKAAFNPNLYAAGTLETLLLVRYYLLPGFVGPFAQAEAGCTFIFADNGNYLVFTGGWTSGWRVKLTSNVFLEPAMRIGYPFFWGISLTAGMRFQLRREK